MSSNNPYSNEVKIAYLRRFEVSNSSKHEKTILVWTTDRAAQNQPTGIPALHSSSFNIMEGAWFLMKIIDKGIQMYR